MRVFIYWWVSSRPPQNESCVRTLFFHRLLLFTHGACVCVMSRQADSAAPARCSRIGSEQYLLLNSHNFCIKVVP